MKNLKRALSLFTVIALMATMFVVPVTAAGNTEITESYVFDGEAKSYTHGSGGAISYELDGDVVENPTNAGTYTVKEDGEVIGYLRIDKAEIEVTGATAVDRKYDGTKDVEIEGATIDTDLDVTLANATKGKVSSADVGEDKKVTTNFTLEGADADNCEVIQPDDIKVTIEKAVINIVPDNMFYTKGFPEITYNVTDEDGEDIDFVIEDMDRATKTEDIAKDNTPYLAMFDMSYFDEDNCEIRSISPAYYAKLSTTSKQTTVKNTIAKYRSIVGTATDRTDGDDEEMVVYLCSNDYVIAMSKGDSFNFSDIKPGTYQLKYTNGTYTNVEEIVVPAPASKTADNKDITVSLKLYEWNADIRYDIEDNDEFPRIIFGDIDGRIEDGHTMRIDVEDPGKEISVGKGEALHFQLTFKDNGDYFTKNTLQDYVKVIVPYTGTDSSPDFVVYKNVKGTTTKTELPTSSSSNTKDYYTYDKTAKTITIYLKEVGDTGTSSSKKNYVTLCVLNSDSATTSSKDDDDEDDDDDVTKYKITVTQTTGGTITPGTSSVTKGSSKTFRIKADTGYKLVNVYVNGDSVGPLSSYTFSNVKKTGTIKAIFEKIDSTSTTNPSTPSTPSTSVKFKDVKTNDWFYNEVNYVAQKGLMNGITTDEFSPNANITRGMFVTVLYRIAGSPSAGSNSFGDVAKGTYYEKAVAWASENDIVSGMSPTEFGPNLNITREQMATMLYRYAKYKEYDMSMDTNVNLKFYDDYSKISSFATDALKWTAGTGLITGTSSSTMDPKMNSTRAMAAAVFMRLVQKY